MNIYCIKCGTYAGIGTIEVQDYVCGECLNQLKPGPVAQCAIVVGPAMTEEDEAEVREIMGY